MTDFTQKVIYYIQKIPRGKVATYGQIAELAGKDHAARGVAWILNSSSQKHKLPWFRVLSSQGKISFPWGSRHYTRQKKLLQSEGVDFLENDRINMSDFQWKKRGRTKKIAIKKSILRRRKTIR